MEIPQRIGRYELKMYLGGGMASVYRAEDTVMDRPVAVKILRELNDGGEAKRRFLREAQVAARLTHGNVVRIYDFGEDNQGRPYMVMEYVPGEDLGKAIRNGATGDLRAKLETALQITAALEYIHAHGIVHRDIKPENICIAADTGDAKLMDFGIAKLGSVSMTQAGYTLGTPPYMAPEQIRSEPVTSVTDIYSFGLLLYELVAGIRAFRGDQYELIFYKVLHEPIDIQPLRAQGASEELCQFISRCAAKDPAHRPRSFSEVRTALRAMLETSGPKIPAQVSEPQISSDALPDANGTSGTESPRWSRTHLIGLAAIAVLFIAVLTLAVMRLLPGKKPALAGLPPQIDTSTGPMFLVPGGTFLAGQDKHASILPDFYIDKTEVTNQAYSAFCKATGRALPPNFAADKPEYPVINVSYADAEAFAKWAGKRLPSSLEWEKVARGTGGSAFPWGDEADPSRANVNNNPNRGTAPALVPAAEFQSSASPFGALNLIGNAWEFVNENTKPTPKDFKDFKKRSLPNLSANDRWVKIRGGSFGEDLDPTAAWNSTPVPADFRNLLIGFRCVQDPVTAAKSR